MGGWRCSYRNCSMKYDGKTHMFHYPVFDKVRCHQWLVNTGRLDFLNLKVSQLKNRVICQHHFNKEYFMNFKVMQYLVLKHLFIFVAVVDRKGVNVILSSIPSMGKICTCDHSLWFWICDVQSIV